MATTSKLPPTGNENTPVLKDEHKPCPQDPSPNSRNQQRKASTSESRQQTSPPIKTKGYKCRLQNLLILHAM
eukprot:gene13207-9053_t